jgi:hypothetical protein
MMTTSLQTFRARARGAIVAALVMASCSAAAEGGSAVTLYGGARGGGEFSDEISGSTLKLDSAASGAVSFDWLFSDGQQGQVFYSFQRSALPGSVLNQPGDIPVNISYLHIGGRVFFDGSHATNAGYVVGGLGVTLMSPSGAGLSSEVRPSMNVGVGYQWMLGKQVSLRTELRGYFTLINSEGGFFCSGGCVVSIRGDAVSQYEGLLGLSYSF